VGVFGFANEDRFDALIWTAAGSRGLDPLLVKAVIAKESSFNPQAYRAEPRIQDASRGLMQVLYGTASWLGYTGTPEGLFDPATSIQYGTAYLANRWIHYQSSPRQLTDAMAAYNAGTAYYDDRLGVYANQEYVTAVLRYFQGYRDQEAQAPPTAGGTVADVLRDQPAQAPPSAGDALERIWTELTGVFSLAPTPTPATAPEDTSAPDPDATPAIATSGEVDTTWLLTGAALLGFVALFTFALEGGK
jgi:Transglycosylase SLT domain